MEALVYFMLWAGLIFLMMRFGFGAHVMGHRHHGSGSTGNGAGAARPQWQPPEHAKDPVCGKRIAVRNAKTSVFDSAVYFFCSHNCREVFEATPEIYIDRVSQPRPKTAEHSHV